MPLQIVTVPCLSDNYAYLVHDPASDETALVDAPESGPILQALAKRGWRLDQVLLTHHHHDHVEGLPAILAAHPARVTGAAADAHRLPPLDQEVAEDDHVSIGAERGRVIAVPGHTVGHIAFHFPDSGLAFTADSLMALGCGRLFEGTPEQMWDSLSKLAALPADTLVCSGHEYTLNNARWAMSVDPGNAALSERAERVRDARAEGRATVPSTLSEELATNPFLRAADADLKAAMDMKEAAPVEVFAALRRSKDAF
ncbi:hydroxyacylglutathione hydrolase [Sediminimonas sp.]|uniref:hydroxyacylglutathione hydrolase n=1 Tax=Sediminimonas sp. TaxID=2823379 RepID=UPI0025FFDF9A|nr:hydroxyacylglutathione hydrolase [Sediminimonas sp.]